MNTENTYLCPAPQSHRYFAAMMMMKLLGLFMLWVVVLLISLLSLLTPR
jgi:hypothetical protein